MAYDPKQVSAYKVDPNTNLPFGGIPSLGQPSQPGAGFSYDPKTNITTVVGGSSGVAGEVKSFNENLAAGVTPLPFANLNYNRPGDSPTTSSGTTRPSTPAEIAQYNNTAPPSLPSTLITQGDENLIAEAGRRAGEQFDVTLEKRRREVEQGKGITTVGLGQRGAGLSSQLENEGRRIAADYDLSLATLEVAKRTAITDAQNAYRTYIKTGKQQDFDNAIKKSAEVRAASDQQFQEANESAKRQLDALKLRNELNKPITDMNTALRNKALEMMTKYPTGFVDLDASSLTKLLSTPGGFSEVMDRVVGSDEYAQELTKDTSTPDIKNYEYAVSQGYTGSLTDYQREKATQFGTEDGDKLLSPSEAASLGVPYGTMKTEAFGKIPTKPATQAEQIVAGYAARLEQSNPILSNLENDITKMNILSYESQIRLPATFQTNKIQQYMQAARNFINANLRRESGAVISPTEFSEARKQYLPQPGDSKETLNQKRANRGLVYNSLKRAAGSAYQSVDELLRSSVDTTENLLSQVEDDITQLGSKYSNREKLIDDLVNTYPELSESEIANKVYSLIPDK